MAQEKPTLHQLLLDTISQFLNALVEKNWDGAAHNLHDLKPVLAGRPLGAELEYLLEEKSIDLTKLNNKLFYSGNAANKDCLQKAYDFVSTYLGFSSPVIIVLARDYTSARHEFEIDGIGFVKVDTRSTDDYATLVHELTHAFIISEHRAIDEGLAEWLSALAVSSSKEAARATLTKHSHTAPTINVLLAHAWHDEPCFESVSSSPRAVHAACALFVADVIASLGMPKLVHAMHQIKRAGTQDVRPLFDDVVRQYQRNGDQHTKQEKTPNVSAHEFSLFTRNFHTGNTEGAAENLLKIRQLSRQNPDDKDLRQAFMRLLVLAAHYPEALDLREELDRELKIFLEKNSDTPLAFALCISREILHVGFAPNFISLHESFRRGRALIETALDLYENDMDVLSLAARFEVYTPKDYGGDPKRTLNILQKVCLLAEDKLVVDHFKKIRDAIKLDVAA